MEGFDVENIIEVSTKFTKYSSNRDLTVFHLLNFYLFLFIIIFFAIFFKIIKFKSFGFFLTVIFIITY